jgi:murein DD-endopeptidase MepM/ murein hydrolase activator NlpD
MVNDMRRGSCLWRDSVPPLVVVLVFLVLSSTMCQRSAPPPTDEAAADATPEPTPAGILTERVIQSGETLAASLAAADLPPPEIARVTAALATVGFPFEKMQKGQEYALRVSDGGAVLSFDFVAGKILSFEVRDDNGTLVARRIEVPTAVKIEKVGARVLTSVYEAILALGESDELASLVSNLFAWDIDFYTDPRRGDGFKLVFEKIVTPDGQTVGYGRLLAGEYDGAVTGRKRGFWLEVDDEDYRGFYDERGQQMRKTFLVAPLDTIRVTSRYGMRRHPILGRRMMHSGVDYGVPKGTPVWAVADGVVVGAGRQGGAGNMVKIDHGGLTTMYLHLSKIAVRKGQRVRQRQMIGRVGSTGRSTGPHLDFRVLQGNRYVNPQTLRMIATPLKKLPESYRPQFEAAMLEMQAQLEIVSLPEITGGTPATE